jgi:hypothetical protein
MIPRLGVLFVPMCLFKAIRDELLMKEYQKFAVSSIADTLLDGNGDNARVVHREVKLILVSR